ncbi:Thioredoxin family protein [Candidatus Bealeia paramacronuclearis]|uniref:Thioredoxin family protein n=1 Tax=Candidatus Bealeia paramacronuclearis TaxID=1921001 RepID=A0ABZ2C5C7_9PROT|nr:Thioredoxin family protein [Candidatus Bealeia paramacronuclearis]
MTVLRLLSALLICIASFSTLLAGETPPFPITLELGQKQEDRALLGLSLDIKAPWQVYAPSPEGEVGFGFPPELTWDKSQNISALTPEWPVPLREKMETGDTAFIYRQPTTVPLTVKLQNAKQGGDIRLKVTLLACSDLCVPVETTLQVTLPPGDVLGDEGVLKTQKEVELEYEGLPIGMLILGALFGGFILNFMPCVLPILSIKLLSLVKHAKKEDMTRAKKGFLISTLGILTSFLLLGGVAVILKASGEAVGWGIHFQNPYFLSFMFAILFLFAASLWGVFDFQLPETVNHLILSENSQGYTKEFLMGMFATLLATPCSAPFVGSAVGFALAHDTKEILFVFLTLGIGFSAPYWITGLLPKRFFWLPRPGAWMLILERILALGLTLSVIWIGFLLLPHVPLWALGLMGGALIILSLIIRFHEQGKLWTFRTTIVTGLFLLLGIVTFPATFRAEKDANYAKKLENATSVLEIWQPFDPEVIPQLVSQGKTVFVDITADWCMTCKANKQFVLNAPKMKDILASPDVVAMQGDWTKQDDEIAEFLQTYARYGIPFNAVFGPLKPEGKVLPELLSESILEEAFATVGFKSNNIHNQRRK